MIYTVTNAYIGQDGTTRMCIKHMIFPSLALFNMPLTVSRNTVEPSKLARV